MKVIFLKINQNKNKSKLTYQINTVGNYLCKKYGYQYIEKVLTGYVKNDFITDKLTLMIRFNNKNLD